MQRRITNILHKKYLCTISGCENNQPWSFICFYKFDPEYDRLIYLTSNQTKHAQILYKNPCISGTIYTPTRFHSLLQGIQFSGKSYCLEGESAQNARRIYNNAFKPYTDDSLDIWEIQLEQIRLIDHSLGRYGKMEWKKGDPESSDEYQTVHRR
ncbi:pyridoxamine 5'-phosphate oxidase family protein [Actinobacillus arthritidis]|uniref:pyridoxamine 5'-phosphate oxidase family protein n=1 Tax=Actinobacillus arthritidis TaxID=157339 RepID=UPI002441E051|nr:pyridoxamine 5'-phosphate oxidase family protein [Actinobacillus arthritidis]WGE89573.1 hypothetical protein NYR89_01040 [Actinobacillus arthritidis]